MFIFIYMYLYIMHTYLYLCSLQFSVPLCAGARCRACIGKECPQTPPRAFPRRPSQSLKGHITCPTC